MKKSNPKRCTNSGNTGQTSTVPSTKKSKPSLKTLIEGPDFVLPVGSRSQVRLFYKHASVVENTALSAQEHTQGARARIELSKRLLRDEGEMNSLRCVECDRVVGGGNYTLYVCTYHKDLTLICTYCQEMHNALHDLALDTPTEWRGY